MVEKLNPLNWRIVRRFAKKSVDDRIPDPILGAVDARYSMIDPDTNKCYIIIYRIETVGTPQVKEIHQAKRRKID